MAKKHSALLMRTYVILVFCFMYLPIAVMIAFSFNESKSRSNFTGFTLGWYKSLFHNEMILSALGLSLVLALVSSIIATVLGTLATLGINSMSRKSQLIINNISYVPVVNPEIITGVSLMLLFVMAQNFGIGGESGIFGWPTLLIAHITFNIPYVIFNVGPKLRQLDPSLYNAALDLGCTPRQAFTKVIMAEALEKWPIDLFSRLLPRVYQIIQEIDRRFVAKIREMYPGNEEKVAKMQILRDGQVKMAHLAIVAGYSVNGVARLHTEILKKQELRDFYEMMPQKFNNKTNGITQRRFLMHGNPLLADWVTDKLGTKDWITDLSLMSGLKKWVDDEEALKEFMSIKYENKVRLAKYIKEHNGIEVDPRSIFDVQVKRLHEYKRQLLNILHVMYL